MSAINQPENRRILIVDDNRAIHDDFAKVLAPGGESTAIDALENSLFGESAAPRSQTDFKLTSAFQGQEAAERIREACAAGTPYAMAFLDIRMPPGWDGVETAIRCWEIDPRLQIVVCSAYSDYSWEQMQSKLGAHQQQLLILKKPFDPVEVLQLAHALTEKWSLLKASQQTREELEQAVAARTRDLEETHLRLRRTEAELRHSQRLEALGRLAGGIAHEINNPLSYVMSNLSFISDVVTELQAPVPISSDLNQATADALSGADRIRRIVRDVKIFSQAEAAALGPVSLETVVQRATQMVRAEVASRAAISIDLGGVAEVTASEEGLVQVLYNLLLNAAQALPEGRQTPNRIAITAARTEDGGVAIEVRDNGVGIPAEQVGRVFEPFFTTRKVGQGTGLGLAICHGIVRKLGGDIHVESQLGLGSTFRVSLPRDSDVVALARVA